MRNNQKSRCSSIATEHQFQNFAIPPILLSHSTTQKYCHPRYYCHAMLFALDICVNKKAPPTHSVNWVCKPPQNHHPLFFPIPPLKSAKCPSPLFTQFNPNILVFHTPL